MRDWDEHRLILALHRGGTLRKAADILGVTHTTIARRLAALERASSTPVFIRRDGAYRTTDHGANRVALSERMEALDLAADRLARGAGDTLSGPLSLSVPQAVFAHLLIDDIAAFSRAHPAIDLTIAGADTFADLDRGEADVVIRGQASPSDHLVGRRICTVGLNYYAHRDYLARTPADELQWITSSAVSKRRLAAIGDTPDWIADSPYPDAPIGMVIDTIASRHVALTRGLGLALSATFMCDGNADLVRLSDAPSQPLYGLWVLTHPDLRNSPKIQALMRWLSDALVRKRDLVAG